MTRRKATIGEVEHFVGAGDNGLAGFGEVIENKGLAARIEAAEPFDIALGNDGFSIGELRVGAIKKGAAEVGEAGRGANLDGFGGRLVA